jgi:hypothetical protein
MPPGPIKPTKPIASSTTTTSLKTTNDYLLQATIKKKTTLNLLIPSTLSNKTLAFLTTENQIIKKLDNQKCNSPLLKYRLPMKSWTSRVITEIGLQESGLGQISSF